MHGGVGVIRMDLHGKLFLRENKFDEQRKRLAPIIDWIARPLDGHLRPRVAELLSGERTGSETAVISGHPCFAQRFGEIRFFGEKWREGASAPGTGAENRLEPRGAQRRPT